MTYEAEVNSENNSSIVDGNIALECAPYPMWKSDFRFWFQMMLQWCSGICYRHQFYGTEWKLISEEEKVSIESILVEEKLPGSCWHLKRIRYGLKGELDVFIWGSFEYQVFVKRISPPMFERRKGLDIPKGNITDLGILKRGLTKVSGEPWEGGRHLPVWQ